MMVRKFATALFMTASLIGVPALVGCDKEVAKEKTVTTTPGGGTKVEEKKVTEKANGTTEVKTETKKVP